LDAHRQNAYRHLLYMAMLDIRVLCQSRGPASANPFEWWRAYRRSREAGALADLLHDARSPRLQETTRPGILAAGDVRAGSIKRVAAAVGEGSAAVAAVHECLKEA
jgi:hypothetical protein